MGEFDLNSVLENGVLGIIALALFIAYKALSIKFPKINGMGGDAYKRSAEALEAIERLTEKQSKALEGIHKQQAEVSEGTKALVDAHLGNFARRSDGTYKWHNNEEREKDIREAKSGIDELLRRTNGK